mgnify:CR=1 FL=1
MTKIEKLQLKGKLTEKIAEFIDSATVEENNIGYVPEDIESLMADAAFAVLETATATNDYFKNEDMLKD